MRGNAVHADRGQIIDRGTQRDRRGDRRRAGLELGRDRRISRFSNVTDRIIVAAP